MSTSSATNIEFTTGKRGKENVIYDGFRYRLDKKRTTADGVRNSYWRCVSDGCSGRLVLHNETVANTPHYDHGEQRAEIVIHRAKKQLKDRAASSEMTTKHITSALAECRSKLGCRTDVLEKMARSARKAANRHPTCPSSLETLVIPPCYLRAATGDNLLLWDSGYTPSLRRSFLLGTADNINVLSSCDNLIIDGTFKVAPHLFTQLLTVHGLTTDGYRLPLAYGLLPGKRQEMYYNLLNELDTNGPFQPLTVLADFEIGLRNAISTTWPNAAIRGCYFHFKQCLWRNFDRLGLTSEYQVVGSDIRRSFQNIGVLPFLPIEDVLDAWIELKPTIPFDMDDFARYFEYTWIGTTGQRALFPPSA